jgi:hypothetical protein
MMFGVGFIMLILVFGLPAILIVVLIWGLTKNASSAPSLTVPPLQPSAQLPARFCAHCGTGL